MRTTAGFVQQFSHSPPANISIIVHSANLRRNSPISAASRLDRVKFSVSAGSCLLLHTYSVGYNSLTGRFNRELLDNLTRAPLILLPNLFLMSSVITPILQINLGVLSECANTTSLTCINGLFLLVE